MKAKKKVWVITNSNVGKLFSYLLKIHTHIPTLVTFKQENKQKSSLSSKVEEMKLNGVEIKHGDFSYNEIINSIK